jgi:hypothetical protein
LEQFFVCEWFIVAGFGEEADDLAKAVPVHHIVFAGEVEEEAAIDEVGLEEEDRCRFLFTACRETVKGREYCPIEHSKREVGFSEGIHGWHRSIMGEILDEQTTRLV